MKTMQVLPENGETAADITSLMPFIGNGM